MDIFVYYTELIGSRVYSSEGRYLGKVHDLMARTEELYPLILRFVIKPPRFGKPMDFPWEAVKSLEKKKVRLAPGGEKKLVAHYHDPDELDLDYDILDMQILDTDGAKVLRVNDIHLLNTQDEMRLVHVDVGMRGLLRRLGFLGFIDAFTQWLFSTKFSDRLIMWKYIVPLGGQFSPLKLTLPTIKGRIADLHPAELADIMEELAHHERQALFSTLDVETAGETLGEIDDPKLQTELIGSVNEEIASDILEEMEPDEAADLLSDLPDKVTDDLIDAMEDKERAEDLRQLMTHEEGTAGSIMTTEYITINPSATVQQTLQRLRKEASEVETINYVYVVNRAEVLRGVVSLKELILAHNQDLIRKIMQKRLISVKFHDSVKDVAEMFGKYNFTMLPVTDEKERLLGVVQWIDAVEAVYPEFARD